MLSGPEWCVNPTGNRMSVDRERPSRHEVYDQWQLISVEVPEVCGGLHLSIPIPKHSRQFQSTGNFIKTPYIENELRDSSCRFAVGALCHPLTRAFSAASIHLRISSVGDRIRNGPVIGYTFLVSSSCDCYRYLTGSPRRKMSTCKVFMHEPC